MNMMEEQRRVALSPFGRRLALAGEGLGWAGIALILYALIHFGSSPVRILHLLPPELTEGVRALDSGAWIAAGLILLISFAVVVWCLIELIRLFAMIRKGDWFGERLERALQRLSIAALVSGFGAIIQRTVLGLIFKPLTPEGKHRLVLQIDSDDVIFALIGIFLALFALIIREARRADDENKGFV